jgi:hypothetical protein
MTTSLFSRTRVLYGCLGGFLLFVVIAVVTLIFTLSVYNAQKRLLVQYEAKVEANKTDLSNLKSKLPEAAAVTTAQMKKLEELFTAYAEARTPEAGGQLMQWVQESVPNVDQKTFTNLQNIIVSTRDGWTQRQKELVDITRVYNTNLETQPRGFILSLVGDFEELDPKIVVTGSTTKAFETGVDEPMDLFPDKVE